MKETLKKQKLFFISLIGIVVVSLIMGTTFAYQTIKINSESERVLVLESGVLDVAYTRTNLINSSNMPLLTSYKFSEDYTEFTVDNTGSNADVAFKIGINSINYGYLNSDKEEIEGCIETACIIDENFKYTIVELVDDKEILKTEGNFKDLSTSEVILSNYLKIEKGKTKTYRLYLWLNETEDNQNHLENTYFKGKIVINSMFSADAPKFLNDTIMNDTRIVKNDTTPTFTGVETNEVGMYKAPDDYGDSWYFRGKQSYNYVNFAGFTWRIVRINGDGSIRLILDGSLDKVYRKNEDGTTSTTPAGIIPSFNPSSNDNAYVGYMYGEFTGNSTSYDIAHKNIKNSTIKDEVDLFYKTYIENNTNNYHFEKYLADTLFCGDKTLANTDIGSSNKATGYGIGTDNVTYYAATERLYYSSGMTSITTANPTLECASNEYEVNKDLTEEQRAYSRYTSKKDMSITTTKGVLVNNDLNYPIALLSADELIMAGGWGGSGTTTNISYYLYDAYGYEIPTLSGSWWTMSPGCFIGSYASEFDSYASYTSLYSHFVTNDINGVRPVINLKAESLVSGGEGTQASPYTIKMN